MDDYRMFWEDDDDDMFVGLTDSDPGLQLSPDPSSSLLWASTSPSDKQDQATLDISLPANTSTTYSFLAHHQHITDSTTGVRPDTSREQVTSNTALISTATTVYRPSASGNLPVQTHIPEFINTGINLERTLKRGDTNNSTYFFPGQVKANDQYVRTSSGSAVEEEEERFSYVALISRSILSSPSQQLLLCDIYRYMEEHLPSCFPRGERSWRNSVRHNLSINDCFVKCGRAENRAKGHYWTIHPQSREMFSHGDFRSKKNRKRGRAAAVRSTGMQMDNTAYVAMSNTQTCSPVMLERMFGSELLNRDYIM